VKWFTFFPAGLKVLSSQLYGGFVQNMQFEESKQCMSKENHLRECCAVGAGLVMVWRSGTDAGRPGPNGGRVGESILVDWEVPKFVTR